MDNRLTTGHGRKSLNHRAYNRIRRARYPKLYRSTLPYNDDFSRWKLVSVSRFLDAGTFVSAARLGDFTYEAGRVGSRGVTRLAVPCEISRVIEIELVRSTNVHVERYLDVSTNDPILSRPPTPIRAKTFRRSCAVISPPRRWFSFVFLSPRTTHGRAVFLLHLPIRSFI